MLKFANLSFAQKRFVVSMIESNPSVTKTGRVTLTECSDHYDAVRAKRTGAKGEKIGYPNWLFNKNKVERGVYELPLPTEVDMTSYAKELAEKQTPKVAKAKAKVAKLQKAKTVKVKTAKPAAEAREEAIETSRLQKIIDESVEVDEDVEDFNAILRENGIQV